MGTQDIRDATMVKEGDLFLLSDLEGNVPLGNGNGLGLGRCFFHWGLWVEGFIPIGRGYNVGRGRGFGFSCGCGFSVATKEADDSA